MQSIAFAQTIRIANQGDALSMDPHSLNESLQLSITGNVYEPLVARNKDLSLAPGLATAWKQVSPTVWQFALREGVLFHDGAPFSADDVVFSLQRAMGDTSDLKGNTQAIAAVRKLGDYLVEIETKKPFPILPDALTLVYMMNRAWCESHQALAPSDERSGAQNAASSQANGTGPFRLTERQANVRSVFERNKTYWGKVEGNVQRVEFIPMPDSEARVSALLNGTVDVMEPVPVQDTARVTSSAKARVVTGPELRTIFLGLDQQHDVLAGSNVRGKNPFKDLRVRQAIYRAIDIDGIKTKVMRGASNPTGLLVGPGINGFSSQQNQRLSYSPTGAKSLLVDAGYPDGFEAAMDCPNDRYVEDAAICRAVVADLAGVGIKVRLQTQSKATYFPKILRRESSFYLLGWTPGTYDALDALNSLTACPNDQGAGQYNLGGYCNPKVDALIARIQSEPDKEQRNAAIAKAFELHSADVGHIPLHQQALAWGVSKRVTLVQLADDFMYFKWMGIQ